MKKINILATAQTKEKICILGQENLIITVEIERANITKGFVSRKVSKIWTKRQKTVQKILVSFGKDVFIFLHMFPKKRICVSPSGELSFNSRELYYQQQRNM